MKNYYPYRTFLFLLCLAFFSKCGMRTVTMNSMQPAEITFPSYVNSLLLVDRTKIDKKAWNIIEGILTGELPGEDRAGLQEVMRAFEQTIMASPRFQVKRASEVLSGNSMSAAFPAPLSWTKVEELCTQYNTEAIIAVEIFDTDFIVTDGKRKVKKQITENGVKKEIEVEEFFAKGLANSTIGIRLYDPKAQKIVDEQLFSKTNSWEAVGSSLRDAAAHLILKADATKYVSNVAGTSYAYKIAPMPVRISRQFYGKGKKVPQIATGTRKADVNDWQGAIDTWQSALNNAQAKDAGRLCYNIAIGYEVLGDLDNAQKWAGRAYVDYGNKNARIYAATLESRKRQEDLVQEQMK